MILKRDNSRKFKNLLEAPNVWTNPWENPIFQKYHQKKSKYLRLSVPLNKWLVKIQNKEHLKILKIMIAGKMI